MTTISFTIPTAQANRLVDAINGLHPVPTTIDENTKEVIPQFTEIQWTKECIRRWMLSQVKLFEEREAKKAISIQVDDALIS